MGNIVKELDDFVDGMVKILDEKYEKYKAGWRTTGIGELREKIMEQMKKISDIIMTGVNYNKEEVIRRMTHVANLCLFGCTNLSK